LKNKVSGIHGMIVHTIPTPSPELFSQYFLQQPLKQRETEGGCVASIPDQVGIFRIILAG